MFRWSPLCKRLIDSKDYYKHLKWYFRTCLLSHNIHRSSVYICNLSTPQPFWITNKSTFKMGLSGMKTCNSVNSSKGCDLTAIRKLQALPISVAKHNHLSWYLPMPCPYFSGLLLQLHWHYIIVLYNYICSLPWPVLCLIQRLVYAFNFISTHIMEYFLLKTLLTVLPLVTLKGKTSLQIYSWLIVLVFQLGKLKHLMNLK